MLCDALVAGYRQTAQLALRHERARSPCAPLRITWLSPATVPLMASAPPLVGHVLELRRPSSFCSCTAEM